MKIRGHFAQNFTRRPDVEDPAGGAPKTDPAQPAAADPAQPAADPAQPAADPAQPAVAEWRTQMAGENADDLKLLERFTDPMALFKSFKEAQNVIRSKGVIALPENATEDQAKAFAAALGLPETPEAFIEAIKVDPPQGYTPSDTDKAFIGQQMTRIHAEIAKDPRPANVAKVFQSIYFESAQAAEKAFEERADVVATETDAALTQEWGTEKEANLNWYRSGLRFAFGEEGKDALASLKLEDGSFLGDHLPFVKAMAAVGRANAEDVHFLEASTGGKAADLDAEYASLMKLKQTDEKKYASPEVQARIDTINAIRERAKQRAA